MQSKEQVIVFSCQARNWQLSKPLRYPFERKTLKPSLGWGFWFVSFVPGTNL